MFGTVTGTTTSLKNIYILRVTRVASRDITSIVALLMIFCNLLGKVGAFLAWVPFPIVATWYCIFDCHIVYSSLGFLQFCNLNNRRNMFIMVWVSLYHFTVESFNLVQRSVTYVSLLHISNDYWSLYFPITRPSYASRGVRSPWIR